MRERGLAEPDNDWTVADFAARARKLVDPDKQVYATHNRNNSATALSIQWIYNWTGHEWLNEDRTEVLLDDPGVAELLEFWRDLQVNQHVIPYAGGFPPRSFDQGGYAITEQYLSLAFSLYEVAFDWIVTLLPKAPYAQKSHAQAHMFSMANGTSQLDAAWRLIEWMASYEGQKAMVEILLRQPLGPYPELWDSFFGRLSPEKATYLRDWLMTTLYGQDYIYNFHYWTTWPEMQSVMNEHLGRIFNQGVPIPNELSVAAQRLRAILEGEN